MKRTDRDHTKLAPALSALSLAVGMVLFYAPGSVLAQDETTVLFIATSDAYVSSDTPDGNYGSTEDLRTDTDPAQISYLKFNVSIPMGGSVAGAKLRLYTSTEATQSGVFVYAVGVTGWNQSTITYSTRPEVGAQLGSTGGWSDGPAWKEASLSSSSIDSGPFALAVEASNTWSKVFGSRESANDPTLEVTYTTDPADPAPNCIGEPPDHPEVDYPEQRVFLESQGWWGERINGDVPKYGDAEHLHIGACFPLQQTVSGTVRMDFRVVAHNAPDRRQLFWPVDDNYFGRFRPSSS